MGKVSSDKVVRHTISKGVPMTTVVFFDGIMASDSQYDNNFQGIGGFPDIPKVIKYRNDKCEFLCGCAGASNLMALAQDFFSSHFNDLSMENIDELIKQLSSIIDDYTTKTQASSNRTLLELLLVIDGKFKVFFYNFGKGVLLNPEQFPSIGTGSDYVKEVIYNKLSAIELAQYALTKDSDSGGAIYTTVMPSDVAPNESLKLAMSVDSFYKSNYFEQLNAMYA